jgi:hypothetical protein
MSGGSYNYLYLRELADNADDIARLAERLRVLGHEDAANRAAESAVALRWADGIRVEMERVWQAVEWCDSSDANERDVANAVERWRRR